MSEQRTLYDYPTARRYRLLRDGSELLRGSEQDCWKYIHDNYPFSVQHALKYGGFQMLAVNPEAK